MFYCAMIISVCCTKFWASLVVQMVKNPPAMQEIWIQSLGWEYPLEEGMATHSSSLAWRIPWTEEPGGLQSMELHRIGHVWAHNRILQSLAVISTPGEHLAMLNHFLYSRKGVQLASSEESPGMRLNIPQCTGPPHNKELSSPQCKQWQSSESLHSCFLKATWMDSVL